MDNKILFGLIAIAIAFVAYQQYIRNILNGKTKPHVFTWFIWGLVVAIEFFGQNFGKAGPGAWVTGVSSLICFFIAFLSIKKGKTEITKLDWLSLVGAIIAILFWLIIKQPLISVILGALIDALGFIPTIRKSFSRPAEETLISYFLNGLKFVFALFALDKFNLLSALYPVYIIFSQWAFVMFVIIRRKMMSEKKNIK